MLRCTSAMPTLYPNGCLVAYLYEVVTIYLYPARYTRSCIKFSLVKNYQHLVVLNISIHKIANMC